MAEWVRSTTEWFVEHPDWTLVVRCHPAEILWDTRQPVEHVIRQHLLDLPANIRILSPSDRTNTYGLMACCGPGSGFYSTTGLEMACTRLADHGRGCGTLHAKRFTEDPQDRASYFQTLERLTAAGRPRRLSAEQVEWAWPVR